MKYFTLFFIDYTFFCFQKDRGEISLNPNNKQILCENDVRMMASKDHQCCPYLSSGHLYVFGTIQFCYPKVAVCEKKLLNTAVKGPFSLAVRGHPISSSASLISWKLLDIRFSQRLHINIVVL